MFILVLSIQLQDWFLSDELRVPLFAWRGSDMWHSGAETANVDEQPGGRVHILSALK
jgi:hypothetical protein